MKKFRKIKKAIADDETYIKKRKIRLVPVYSEPEVEVEEILPCKLCGGEPLFGVTTGRHPIYLMCRKCCYSVRGDYSVYKDGLSHLFRMWNELNKPEEERRYED